MELPSAWRCFDEMWLPCKAQVIGFVIGAKGATKSRVEQETGSSISVSSKSRDPSEPAEVIIRAASRQAAVSAANRVNLLIDGALSGSR